MDTTLAIYRYFPHGGLQRDMRRIAEELLKRGHRVTIFTARWDAEAWPEVEVRLLPAPGCGNHIRMRNFGREVLRRFAGGVLVGFNRLPGLDVYFAADNCFGLQAARKPWYAKLFTRRYRIFGALEQAVCDPASGPGILYLTPRQKCDFQRLYRTPDARFTLLPPGIASDRKRPEETRAQALREAKRGELGIAPDELLLLSVGSGFRTKGVDRTVAALAGLPEELRRRTRWLVAGYDGHIDTFRRRADALGLHDRIIWAGGREDVPELLLAADALVHPARNEATGTVLIEAIAAGLPPIASGCCGFAGFVADSGGVALSEPFNPNELQTALRRFLGDADYRNTLARQVRAYGGSADFYRRAEVACDHIEAVSAKKQHAGL